MGVCAQGPGKPGTRIYPEPECRYPAAGCAQSPAGPVPGKTRGSGIPAICHYQAAAPRAPLGSNPTPPQDRPAGIVPARADKTLTGRGRPRGEGGCGCGESGGLLLPRELLLVPSSQLY